MTNIDNIKRAIIGLERSAGSPVAISDLRAAMAGELPGEAFDAAMINAFEARNAAGLPEVQYVRCDPATHAYSATKIVVWPAAGFDREPDHWINFAAVRSDDPTRSKES